MAAIAGLSDLINRSTGGNSGTPQNVFYFKVPRIAGGAPAALTVGRLHSLWRYDGSPGAGSAPGAVAIPTNATAGALPFISAGGARESWLTQVWAAINVSGTLILYDRLLHQGNLSGTVTTAQTVGGTLTRNTGGVGNLAFIEIYTNIGTTSRTVTMNYTNQAGTSSRTSTAVQIGATGFLESTRMLTLPLQTGDTGIREIASITLSASTGTAGAIGVTIGDPIAYIGVGLGGSCGWRDFVTGMPGIPRIESDACLSLMFIPTTSTVPDLLGGYSIVEA